LVNISTFELHEDVLLDTGLIGLVRFYRGVGRSAKHCWVDHNNEIPTGVFEGVNYILDLVESESIGVERLDPSFIHVIDILKVSPVVY
jgi:hypothetical protein